MNGLNTRYKLLSTLAVTVVASCAAQSVNVLCASAGLAQGAVNRGAVSPVWNYSNGFNNGGYVGSPTNPYIHGYPVYPFGNPYINPIARGNGFYGFNGGGLSVNNMWRAPSGYYYPWYGAGAGFNQIIYVDNTSGQNQTMAKDPPLSSMFSDMGAYLDDSKKNNKVSENDYQSLKRRLTDIHSKERSLRIAGGGQIAEGDESEIRQNLNDFSREMVERIKI